MRMLRACRKVAVIGTVAAVIAAGVALAAVAMPSGSSGVVAAEGPPAPDPGPTTDCALRYVAGGDGVVKGTDSSDTDRYSNQLLEKLKASPSNGPWCLYNTSVDPTSSGEYVDRVDGNGQTQRALANDLRPRLITLEVGRQNTIIKEHITTCLKFIKDHDFIEANVCALAVLAAQPAFDTLRDELANILNGYKVQMDGNPDLVVAVLGYFNPYPAATSVATDIPGFCSDLQDTIPTCLVRWIMLPPALVTLDQIVKKLNSTIEPVVKQFRTASQGRYFFINPYDKFKDHCTEMTVKIQTTVYHPTNTVHNHNTDEDFGCSDGDDTWIASDGNGGFKTPFLYLTPAVTGVLLTALQQTTGMGINPNKDGHACLADMVYQTVKNKLDIPEAPEEPCP